MARCFTEGWPPHIPNGDVVSAYIGLLCQSKSDFDQIEPFREDPFFRLSLDLKEVPSSPTLRHAWTWRPRRPIGR